MEMRFTTRADRNAEGSTMSRLFVLLSVLTASASSAAAQTVDDAGMWFAAFGNGTLQDADGCDTRYRWWFDSHYRLFDDAGGYGQSIIRPGLGVEVADDQVLWAGYAWIRTESRVRVGNVGTMQVDEHRGWEQWTWAPSAGDWRFLHRSRFEQRWVETGNDVGLRFRQLARAQRLLPGTDGWSLVAWDEVFLNFNDTDWGAESGYDQNRAFLGVGLQDFPLKGVRGEVGYLNQHLDRSTDRMNHILSFNVFF